MALKLASQDTKRIDLMDDQWVDVKTDIDKRTMNALVTYFPKRSEEDIKESGLTPEEGTNFQTGLFTALVTAWSLDVPATPANYLSLAAGAELEELEAKLMEHFEKLMPSKEEQGKP